MKKIFEKKNLKIQNVKIFEIFEDGDEEAMDKILAERKNDLKSVLNLKNYDKRTPLHMVCKKGYSKMVLKLIPYYIKENISLDQLDENGDTPLLLACSHGFDEELDLNDFLIKNEEDEQTNIFLENKFIIVKSLLENGVDIKKSISYNKNNPLHWAVYYGDYQTGKLIYEKYPLIILRNNNDNHTPLEILLQKTLKKMAKFNAKRLVNFIINKFVTSLLNVKNKNVFKNATEDEIHLFKILKTLKSKNKSVFNTKTLLESAHALEIKKKPRRKSVYVKLMDNIKKKEDGKKLNEIQKILEKKIPDEFENKNEEISEENKKEEIPKENKKKNSEEFLKNSSMMSENKSIYSNINEISENELEINNSEKKLCILYKNDDSHNNHYIIFMHKLLMISVLINSINIIKILIDSFMISPFIISINDITALNFACYKGYFNIVNFFLNSGFYYYKNEKEFSIKEEINKKRGIELNSCLHFACLQSRKKIFNLLIDKGADINSFNYQDFRPLDLNKKKFFIEKEIFLMNEMENKNIIKYNKNLTKIDSFSEEAIKYINEDFIYIILTNDIEEDPEKTLVYLQLKQIKEDWNNKLEIKHMIPFKKKNKDLFRHYYLLKLEKQLIEILADYLDFQIFNLKCGYVTTFIKEKSKDYAKFRDYHIHQIIDYLLNTEFNLNHYIKTGIIEEAFPLHEFRTRQNIKDNWDKEKFEVFFDPWKLTPERKDLRPFNSIAFYYGCEEAFYLSFNVLLTSYLLILCFIGVIIFFISYFYWKDHDNQCVPIYAFLICLWVTLVFKKWEQRENEHVKIWNTENFKENELPRLNYNGNYVIDPISKKITKKNKFSTFKRRLITEIPLVSLGALFIIALFILIIYLNNKINDMTDEELKSILDKEPKIVRSILLICTGLLNGILIFILTEVYKVCSNLVVDWENHLYESDKENSFIVKTFIFNFFISYLNLFYYAFIIQNFDILATNFISIIISKNLMFFLKINLIPYLIYRFKKHHFLKKWISYRKILKNKYLKETGIFSKLSSKNFQNLKPNEKDKLFEIEKELILQEQIEISILMADPIDLIELWKNSAIQFGYISFFSVAFPAATLWGLLVNIFHIYFIYFSSTDHIKRTPSKERDSIGVWKYIFDFMTFASLVVNIGILVFTSEGMKRLVTDENGYFNKYNLIIILVIAEHTIFVIIYIFKKLISKQSSWVKIENENIKFKKTIDEEVIKRKLIAEEKNFKQKEGLKGLHHILKSTLDNTKKIVKFSTEKDNSNDDEGNEDIKIIKKTSNKSIFGKNNKIYLKINAKNNKIFPKIKDKES